MATEVTETEEASGAYPKEARQERHAGTVDISASTGSITFGLVGNLRDPAMGAASVSDGSITVTSISTSSMTVSVSGASPSEVSFQAYATDHVWSA